jgi:hypothetical protein
MSARPPAPSVLNSLISTNINNKLLVEDETSATRYRFIYSTLPTLDGFNLGGGNTFNYTGELGVGANGYVNSPPVVVTVGTYIVHAYAQFTSGTSSTNTLRLGINTTTSAYSTIYYPTIDVNVASVTVRSIRYINIITVSLVNTEFYFVFFSQLAGNLTLNTLNGRFLRIG